MHKWLKYDVEIYNCLTGKMDKKFEVEKGEIMDLRMAHGGGQELSWILVQKHYT